MQKTDKTNKDKVVIVTSSELRNSGLNKDQAYNLLQGLVSRGLAERIKTGTYQVNSSAYEEVRATVGSIKKAAKIISSATTIDGDSKPEQALNDSENPKCGEEEEESNSAYHKTAITVLSKMQKEVERAYDWREIYIEVLKSECPQLIHGEPITLHPTKDWEYTAYLQLTDTHANTDRLMKLLPKMAAILSDVPGILTKIVVVVTGDMMDNTHLYPGQAFLATHNNARQQVNSFINVVKTLEFLERFMVDSAADNVELKVYWCLGNHTREAAFAKGGPANAFDNWEHGMMLMVSQYMKSIGSRAEFFSPDFHNRGYLEVPTTEEVGDKKTATEMWPFMTFHDGNCVCGMTHGHIVRMSNRTPHYGIEHAVQQWKNQLRPEDHILPKLFFMGHFHRSMSDIIHGTHFYMGGSLQEINAHAVRFSGSSYLSQNLVIWKTTPSICEWGVHRLLIQ